MDEQCTVCETGLCETCLLLSPEREQEEAELAAFWAELEAATPLGIIRIP